MSKIELRESARAARHALGSQNILALSENIRQKLENLEEFKASNVIATYVSKQEEVQTEHIIRDALSNSKRVLVPLVVPRNKNLVFSELHDLSELAVGHFGILEPKPEFVRPVALSEASMIIVPVVAWDERGYRIGNGGGYFDIALAPLKGNLTIGLAFEVQRVVKVPADEYDVPLKMIVTESRILKFEKD
ncbi:MAG: 5-formyltetrahydrofolate cyclo-ligase [Nitrososphaerota archaeon]|nr:5-formyltetrahydrofolate cyclo-ligase [Nitrososphaerota archaeon]